MNISNHSFDNNKGNKIKIKVSHIIILSLLMIILIAFIVLFVLIKKNIDKEKEAGNKGEDVVTTESFTYTEENFTSLLDETFSNMYGYDFDLIINGNNNDFSYMGDFLDDIFLQGNVSNEIEMIGNVYSSGASFKTYKGKYDEENNTTTYTTYVSKDGVFVTGSLGAVLVNRDSRNESDYIKNFIIDHYCKYHLKINNGIRGEDIIPTFVSAINNCDADKISYGKTTNNNYGVSIKDGALSLPEDNPLATIVNGYHGDLTMEISIDTNIDGLKVVTILGEGTDISFKFVAVENQTFYTPPYYYNYKEVISIDEFKEKYGEFDFNEP